MSLFGSGATKIGGPRSEEQTFQAEVAAAGIKLGSDVAEMEACEVESALA
jgi:hypothetical protein